MNRKGSEIIQDPIQIALLALPVVFSKFGRGPLLLLLLLDMSYPRFRVSDLLK